MCSFRAENVEMYLNKYTFPAEFYDCFSTFEHFMPTHILHTLCHNHCSKNGNTYWAIWIPLHLIGPVLLPVETSKLACQCSSC